jgi:hypothetical protein
VRLVVGLALATSALGACSGVTTRTDARVAPRETAASCGSGARPGRDGCEPIPCGPNEAIDYGEGRCLSAKALRDLAEHQGTTLYEGEALVCPDDQRLLVSGSAALCVPAEVTCVRGTHWVGASRACVPWPPCDRDAIRDPAPGARPGCVPIVTARDGESPIVDVGTWTRLAFGADGGPGASDLCGAIARDPNAFGLAVQGSATLTVQIDVSFPDNDVSQVSVQARATSESGNPSASSAIAALDAATIPLVKRLGALGGVARAAATHTTVRCTVKNLARPHAEPVSSPAK